MKTLFRTDRPEWATRILLEHFKHVLVRAHYDNYTRIRFRADDVQPLYFNKVPSQHRLWQERGGALLTWKSSDKEGAHDAIVFAECPKDLRIIERAMKNTAFIGVVYLPPTWRPHEETIQHRHRYRPRKLARAMRRLDAIKSLEILPVLTKKSILRLLRAREEAVRSLSSLAPRAGVARSSRRNHAVP